MLGRALGSTWTVVTSHERRTTPYTRPPHALRTSHVARRTSRFHSPTLPPAHRRPREDPGAHAGADCGDGSGGRALLRRRSAAAGPLCADGRPHARILRADAGLRRAAGDAWRK